MALLDKLLRTGLSRDEAALLVGPIEQALARNEGSACFQALAANVLRPSHPDELHRFLFEEAYRKSGEDRGVRPAYVPQEWDLERANITRLCRRLGLDDHRDLHPFSVNSMAIFWEAVLAELGIRFHRAPEEILGSPVRPESPDWLRGARYAIEESCFQAAPDALAIVWRRDDGAEGRWSYGDLEERMHAVAAGIVDAGFAPGDAIAIDMPMTADSVAIYLGIVRAGCAVVSIADSFAPLEIAKRLRIASAKAIFTQDVIHRGGKELPLYERVCEAEAPRAVVLPAGDELTVVLREGDIAWDRFLRPGRRLEATPRPPSAVTNILYSSGTTGDPKAIPWTQMTPIKAAADGWLHQDIHRGDVVMWPTNLGWMMGPWLVYASFVNQATMVLYVGAPTGRGFAEFVQDAGVTMLGVVPTMVKNWRSSGCLDKANLGSIGLFSSTGEASNAEDYFWLMGRAGYRPVIEYCGGTELGGGYITGSVVEPQAPGTFSTPAFGSDFRILDEQGREADEGEVCLLPPSLGMSERLLNRDHHEIYYQGMAAASDGRPMRRHGDRMERLPGGYYRALGRVDDTMNLSGIKVSSREIEEVVGSVPGIGDVAAVAVPGTEGGAERLVIFVAGSGDSEPIRKAMQKTISERLNPLFRVHAVRFVEGLPRTASGKVMRRKLREMARLE